MLLYKKDVIHCPFQNKSNKNQKNNDWKEKIDVPPWRDVLFTHWMVKNIEASAWQQ